MNDRDRDGGVLFSNDRKTSEKAPDYKGELRVSREVVEALVAQIKAGVQNPMIELAGWKRTANNGTTFISMSGKKPYEKTGSGGGGMGRQGSGGSGQWPPQNQSPYGGGQAGQGTPPPSGGKYGQGNIDDEIPF